MDNDSKMSLNTLLDRVGDRVSQVVTDELAKVLALVADTNEQIRELKLEVDTLHRRIDSAAAAGVGALADGVPPPPPGAMPAADVRGGAELSNNISVRFTALEERIKHVEDESTREILDAIVSVAQHLEAVQTATAWAILREVGR